MATFYAFYPPSSSGTFTDPSIGVNGLPIPTSSTQAGAENPTGNLEPLQVDASKNLLVSIAAQPLAALNTKDAADGTPGAANPTTAIQVAGTDGTDLRTLSTSNTGQLNVNNISGTVSLPTGASTALNQTNVQSAPGTPQTVAVTVQGNTSGVPVPVSGTVAVLNPSVSATGAAVPVDATMIGGTDGTDLRAISTDASGNVNINNISGTVSLPTNAATSTKQSDGTQKTQIVDGSGNVIAATSNALNVDVTNTSLTVIQGTASSLKTQATLATPTAGTVTQAAISVGTSAVRLTVSGSAPAATRSLLMVIVDNASTATFYIGSSSVTNTSTGRGIQIVAGMPFVVANDAGDYYIIASTTSQTVYVMEQA